MPASSPPAAAEAGPAPQHPFEPDGEQGEHEHQRGQFGGRVAVVGAPPDPEHADRHRVDAEVLDGGEVGERLHHDHGGPGGDRRTQHREHDAPRRLGRRGPERAGDEVGAGRLVAQRGPGQQVHVGVERERERDDGAGHRSDVGEPGIRDPNQSRHRACTGPATPNTEVVTKPRM